MRWTPGGLGPDVEDRRGAGGGIGFGGMRGMGGLGCGGVVILLVLSLITGKNFFSFFDGSGGGGQVSTQTASPATESPEERKSAEFVSFVMTDAQDTWTRILPEQQGTQYRRAKVVLFRDIVQSACGTAQSASGPFYCPLDERVFIDLAFYDELRQRFGAPGDFAQAYVIAHEVGHHVQTILGISERVREAQQRDSRNANEYSVRLELQADCFAGLWAHSTQQRQILEEGDVDEGLNAAAAIGDDRMQRDSGRRVNPDSFTHGSSAQRQEWFHRGLRSGQISACDTFSDLR